MTDLTLAVSLMQTSYILSKNGWNNQRKSIVSIDDTKYVEEKKDSIIDDILCSIEEYVADGKDRDKLTLRIGRNAYRRLRKELYRTTTMYHTTEKLKQTIAGVTIYGDNEIGSDTWCITNK